MWISEKQINYIIYLLERSEDIRLQKLFLRVPKNNKKYYNEAVDYKRQIIADRLKQASSREEACGLIGWLFKPTNQNIIKVESYLKSYLIIQ